MHVPSHFRLLFSAEQIQERTSSVGASISPWANSVAATTQRDVLAIPVLRGGIFFFADLVRAIDCSVEVVPAQSWNYEVGKNAAMNENVKIDINGIAAKGRSILLIDDICDSGKTLDALSSGLRDAGAKEVKSAVLIRRKIETPSFFPDYVGFDYEGSEWFVGYGMEDGERFRNLPEIYVIEQS